MTNDVSRLLSAGRAALSAGFKKTKSSFDVVRTKGKSLGPLALKLRSAGQSAAREAKGKFLELSDKVSSGVGRVARCSLHAQPKKARAVHSDPLRADRPSQRGGYRPSSPTPTSSGEDPSDRLKSVADLIVGDFVDRIPCHLVPKRDEAIVARRLDTLKTVFQRILDVPEEWHDPLLRSMVQSLRQTRNRLLCLTPEDDQSIARIIGEFVNLGGNTAVTNLLAARLFHLLGPDVVSEREAEQFLFLVQQLLLISGPRFGIRRHYVTISLLIELVRRSVCAGGKHNAADMLINHVKCELSAALDDGVPRRRGFKVVRSDEWPATIRVGMEGVVSCRKRLVMSMGRGRTGRETTPYSVLPFRVKKVNRDSVDIVLLTRDSLQEKTRIYTVPFPGSELSSRIRPQILVLKDKGKTYISPPWDSPDLYS